MFHPFKHLSRSQLNQIFWPLFIATLLMVFLMNQVSAPLNTSSAPAGIVSYELAQNPEQVAQILAEWDQNTRLYAAFSLGLDYLFMPLYSSAIGLGCLIAFKILHERRLPFAVLGAPLAWGQWLAAILDAVENVALWVMLSTLPADPWPQIAFWCAVTKFSLIILGLVYSLYAGVVRLLIKPEPQTPYRP